MSLKSNNFWWHFEITQMSMLSIAPREMMVSSFILVVVLTILGSTWAMQGSFECYGDVDCPRSRPACVYGVCKNTCDGACGIGADCNLRGLIPVCSCPRDMTGDPFIRCRPFTKQDLCEPNPCGTNAQCVPGYDNTNKERPVCTCFPGYTGNALSYCARSFL